MGLDGIAIVMATEQTFSVDIPDADAERMRTPRHLLHYVAARMALAPESSCLSQRMFYRVRQGFRTQVAALAHEISLDTPLTAILRKDQWQRVWSALRRSVGAPFWPDHIPWPGLLTDGPKTLRQLVVYLLKHEPPPAPGTPWTLGQLEAALRRIILEETGQEGFSLKAEFVRDLGIN